MTSIFKRSSSPYYYIKVRHPNGKWRMKSTGTRDRKLAEKILNREEWRVWDEGDNRTVQELVDEFLAYQEKRRSIPYWGSLKARISVRKKLICLIRFLLNRKICRILKLFGSLTDIIRPGFKTVHIKIGCSRGQVSMIPFSSFQERVNS